MWINRKKIFKNIERMTRELERDEDRLSDYDKGYDVGYINGVHSVIGEPAYDLRLMAMEYPREKNFMRKIIAICQRKRE